MIANAIADTPFGPASNVYDILSQEGKDTVNKSRSM